MAGLDHLILPGHLKKLTAANRGGAPGVERLDLRGRVFCPACKSAEFGFDVVTDVGEWKGEVAALVCRKCKKQSIVFWIGKGPQARGVEREKKMELFSR